MKSDLPRICRSYISAQTADPFQESLKPEKRRAAITLSRQAGARGRSIARQLAERLNARQGGTDEVPWRVFDRDLMDRVMSDHQLPRELARFFPEARCNELGSTLNSLLRRHPDSWTIFEHTVDSIGKLGHLGHAIIVGRGANFILRDRPNVLHLRLIGSRERRLEHLSASRGWSEAVAVAYLESEDRNRQAYVHQHFGGHIGDAEAYSAVLHTDQLDDASIVGFALAWVESFEHTGPAAKETARGRLDSLGDRLHSRPTQRSGSGA
jgi:hypothetical protein